MKRRMDKALNIASQRRRLQPPVVIDEGNCSKGRKSGPRRVDHHPLAKLHPHTEKVM
jgi:hypothetical protein